MVILWLVVGLVLLVAGAELLVRGASRIAAAFGISPLIIGLTVVAFGTSAPEMAVSVLSALKGQADLAVGNVVGSNLFNVLFILGLSALITPLTVSRQLIRLDVPLMIGASLLMLGMAWNGWISRLEGGFLFLGILGYTAFLIRQARRERSQEAGRTDEFEQEFGGPAPTGWKIHLLNAALVAAGLGLLLAGSKALVTSAVAIATRLGVSELVIGLTIVAAGTSLPEVATSVVASLRGERDIAVGNVVGSNIFNILAVLGLSSWITPGGIPVSPSTLAVDIPLMLGVAVACLPVFFSGWRITRLEGTLFLLTYLAYTLWLVLAAMHHTQATPFGRLLLFIVLPLALLLLALDLHRDWRTRRP